MGWGKRAPPFKIQKVIAYYLQTDIIVMTLQKSIDLYCS